MRAIRQAARLILPILLILPVAACGSSGGGMMNPGFQFVFVAGSPPAPMTITAAPGPGTSSAIIEVEVSATGVQDVLAASFTLNFDAAAVNFLDFNTTGSNLGSGGTTVQPIVQLTQPGILSVGVTRLASSGVDFNGTQSIVRIRFTRVAASGASILTFSNENLLDDAAPPQPISGLQWFGGTFQIN